MLIPLIPQLHKFKVGDDVFIKEFPFGKYWLPGVISSAGGPHSYYIILSDKYRVQRYLNYIRKHST